MGRRKPDEERTWDTPTNRTIYQWAEASKHKDGVETTKRTAWTQAVRNRMRQKAGEIQAHRAYEKGVEKWRKEHMPGKGRSNISAEGQELLEDKELWENDTALREAIHDPGKGKDPMKTACSCHTRRDLLLLHSRQTGSYGRDRAVSS